jgi:hypothetical protein
MAENNISLMERLRNSSSEKDINRAYDSRTVNAIAVVINYTMSDAFDLTMEESIIVSWMLQNTLEPLREFHAENLQAAVKQELDTFIYSNALFERDKERGTSHKQVKDVKYASLDEWTKALTEIIFASYCDLRPMITASIIGSISGMLIELGLSNDKSSRASLYLPTTLRYMVANRGLSSSVTA